MEIFSHNNNKPKTNTVTNHKTNNKSNSNKKQPKKLNTSQTNNEKTHQQSLNNLTLLNNESSVSFTNENYCFNYNISNDNKKSRFNNYGNIKSDKNVNYSHSIKSKYVNNNNNRYETTSNSGYYYNRRNNKNKFHGLNINLNNSRNINATNENIISNDFSKLPNVVLTNIYSFLNLSDRLNASLTCKNWRLGLFNPCLWHKYNLHIYLTNHNEDLKSSLFKARQISKYTQYLTIKYDPNDMHLVKHASNLLENFIINKNANSNISAKCSSQANFFTNYTHLKCISLQPIFNFTNCDYELIDEDELKNERNYNENDYSKSKNKNDYVENSYGNYYVDTFGHKNNNIISSEFNFTNINKVINEKIFKSLDKIILNSRCIEHLSLGLLTDLNRHEYNLPHLINNLTKKHLFNLKSLHISSMNNSSIISLSSISSFHKSSIRTNNEDFKKPYLSNFLCQFINLSLLTINYNDLSEEFLKSAVSLISLKKLKLNVNSLANEDNDYDQRISNDTWSHVKFRNPALRVTVNFLVVEEKLLEKYKIILNQNMPLQALRMYFCKSLNPDLIQYLSDSYCETLESLVVVDAITDPTLIYHNPLRHDADPDPLVLLCWKCRYLQELVIVGYEMLEINLIAIAKLRNNLKTFYIPLDCIIDLRYGKFKNDDFIEDEDGEDTIVDYGFCSDQVIHKVCKILNQQNWHPLEKDELPMCLYDYEMPYEEAFLDTLIKDQVYE